MLMNRLETALVNSFPRRVLQRFLRLRVDLTSPVGDPGCGRGRLQRLRRRGTPRCAAAGPQLFRRPNVLAANRLALLNLAVMCSLFFFLSLYLQLVGGTSALRTGITLLTLTLLGAVCRPLAGWITSRTGLRPLIAAGMAATAAGLALLTRIQPGWTPGR